MVGIFADLADRVSGVVSGKTAADFEQFFETELLEPIADALHRPAAAAPARTVVLLPGILGSALMDVTPAPPRRLWLDLLDLGAMKHLAFQPGDTPADDHDAEAGVQVEYGDPLFAAYGLLLLYFRAVCRFNVIPLCYDWRRSFDEIADDVATRLPPGAFSIVGHSMGCLVARRLVQRHRGIVDRIDHAVFMGPPFQGSHVPLRVLAGEDWFASAFTTVAGALPGTVLAACPGFGEMAPDPDVFPDAAGVFGDPHVRWATPPDPHVVQRAAQFAASFRTLVGDVKADDDKLMKRSSIVLGLGHPTPATVARNPDGSLRFTEVSIGDNTVVAHSAWDARSQHFKAHGFHPLLAQEPTVFMGAASLLQSSGADAGLLQQLVDEPVEVTPSRFELFAPLDLENVLPVRGSGERALPVLPPPGFAERQAAGHPNNADLQYRLAHGEAAAPAPAPRDRLRGPASVEVRREAFEVEHGAPVAMLREALPVAAIHSATDDASAVAERALAALAAALEAPGGQGWRLQKAPPVQLAAGLSATPDLAGWSTRATPPDGHLPSFCAEVLTAATARDARRLKLPLYAQAGVAWVWLIDPELELVEVYQCGSGRPTLVDTAKSADVLRLLPFGVEVSVGSLWRQSPSASAARGH
jgi:pimeloyl-ACP methyl ester carboxylesterase